MLGICNGFQALLKLGLIPFGEITNMTSISPTLTFNTIARHQSMLVRTRIASNKSPWLYGCEGDIRYNPNTSMLAIEGLTSPDGRVLGKMGHSERIGRNLYKNVPGNTDQKIFESGVAYFK